MKRRAEPAEELDLELDEASYEAEPPPRPKRAPDHTPAHLRFTHKESGEFIGGRPYTPDRETWKRFIRGATDRRGAFSVELRNRNQSIIEHAEIEVPEAAAGSTSTQPAPSNATGSVAAPSAKASEVVSEITQTVRAVHELSESVSQGKGAAVSRDEVRGIIRDEVRDSLAEVLRAMNPPTPPKSLAEQAREIKEAAELLGISNPPKAEPSSDLDTALSLYDKLLQIRDRVDPRPIDENADGFTKAAALADAIGRNAPAILSAVMPLLPARMRALLAGADASDVETPAPTGAGQQQQAPKPQQPKDSTEAFALIMHVGAADLIKNKRPGRTADLIEEMALRFPDITQAINEFIAMEPAAALNIIMQMSGRNDLATYGHSYGWVMRLQDELRPEEVDDQDEAAEISAESSANGHQPGAAVVAGK